MPCLNPNIRFFFETWTCLVSGGKRKFFFTKTGHAAIVPDKSDWTINISENVFSIRNPFGCHFLRSTLYSYLYYEWFWGFQLLVPFGWEMGQNPSTFSCKSFPWSHLIDQQRNWKIFQSWINNLAWEVWWSKYFMSNFCFEVCHLMGKYIGDQGID